MLNNKNNMKCTVEFGQETTLVAGSQSFQQKPKSLPKCLIPDTRNDRNEISAVDHYAWRSGKYGAIYSAIKFPHCNYLNKLYNIQLFFIF
jgi:hypothetical protein